MPYQQIMDRDLEVVQSIYQHRYLTSSQVQALHFPSATTRNRRLQRLIEHGFIKPFSISNVADRLFKITRKGAQVVASYQGVDIEDLHWNPNTATPSDHFFMRHFVAVNDYRLALTQAEAPNGVRLRGFIPEYWGTKHQSGRVIKYLRDRTNNMFDPGQQISHTPDAVFCMDIAGKSALFFLEIDRGTETLSNPGKGFLKMIRFYLSYLKSRDYRRYAEDFGVDFDLFRMLIVTTSQARTKNMKQACLTLPTSVHKGLRFLWCTHEAVRPETIYHDLWASLLLSDDRTYRIA